MTKVSTTAAKQIRNFSGAFAPITRTSPICEISPHLPIFFQQSIEYVYNLPLLAHRFSRSRSS